METLVYVDEQGVTRLKGSRMSVKFLAVEKDRLGWTPEEIHKNHPYLSMVQIDAALTYYHDHKAELNEQISREEEDSLRMHAAAGETPFVRRMKAEGRLP